MDTPRCRSGRSPQPSRDSRPLRYWPYASIWCLRREFLLEATHHLDGKTLIHEMPDYTIDIDGPLDFEFVEFVIESGRFTFDYEETTK